MPEDLGIVLDKNSDIPLWKQIRDHIIASIASGELQPEQKMPTIRNLAADLDVSISVVNQAYRYLRLVGYVESKQGSGIRVRRRTDTVNTERDSDEIGRLTAEYVEKMVSFGIPRMDVPNTVSYFLYSHQLNDPEESD